MNSLAQSIANSMDCTNHEIIPFLPYILQDFWEIGASPPVIKNLIEKHTQVPRQLRALDLGCGKGAVTITLASELHCYCLGIDAIEEFINEAKSKAKALHLDSLCSFEVNDIRQRITELPRYDVIILGAIGPVFGNYYETLTTLATSLNDTGIIIIDDGYIDDSSSFEYPLMLKKGDLFQQIHDAGMQLIDEVIMSDMEEAEEVYGEEFQNIERRCHELRIKHPEKAYLFEEYLHKQQEEYDILKHKVVCATFVIQSKITM
ncbi:MAG: class I SAM-dependent methyltransferase [Candidatus Vecturithrix sp.]|jgi:protein-L-isoaspartate O-methyltransferase|nr:class I SAM-dependent methyltransferase [Candidatus Vecturithrix sp.]